MRFEQNKINFDTCAPVNPAPRPLPPRCSSSLPPSSTATAAFFHNSRHSFQQLLRRDPYLLDGISFAGSRNLLHIATIWGHAAIVEEVLKIHPQLAEELDSEKSSPLHIAAAKGHAEIASKLLNVAAHMCWSRDCHGMNPIHIAAMNGHVEILEELIRPNHLPAMEKVDRGQTVLHLCVKHRRFRELEFLVGKLGDVVDSKNDDGETILHLAARYENVLMLRWLVVNTKIDKQAKEWRGRRAVEILEECSSDSSSYSDIIEVLRGGTHELAMETLVVAVLIVAMVFQATISPQAACGRTLPHTKPGKL